MIYFRFYFVPESKFIKFSFIYFFSARFVRTPFKLPVTGVQVTRISFDFKRNHHFLRISLSIPWTLTRLQTSLSKSNYPLQLIWLIARRMHVLQTVCFYQKNIRVNNRHDSCFYTNFTKLDYTQNTLRSEPIFISFFLFQLWFSDLTRLCTVCSDTEFLSPDHQTSNIHVVV